MSFRTYFWITSLFGFLTSTYIVYTYMSYSRAVKESQSLDLPQNADVSSRWFDMSRDFDDEVELSEKLMGLKSKRRRLCREARGNVLEVSAGTGRNMELYQLQPETTGKDKDHDNDNPRIKSLVFNDLSEVMLYQAQKKFDSLQEKTRFSGDVKFVVGDAADPNLIRRPEGGFDTIVQTMGVCSMANPVGFLRRLGELCRQPGEPSSGVPVEVIRAEAAQWQSATPDRKDYGAAEEGGPAAAGDATAAPPGVDGDLGGKILLLEHGRSYYPAVNRFLDNGAKVHADHYGCWWNKDVDQIVRDSGLVVERKRRHHLGTTYEYVLRPAPAPAPATRRGSSGDGGRETEVGGTRA